MFEFFMAFAGVVLCSLFVSRTDVQLLDLMDWCKIPTCTKKQQISRHLTQFSSFLFGLLIVTTAIPNATLLPAIGFVAGVQMLFHHGLLNLFLNRPFFSTELTPIYSPITTKLYSSVKWYYLALSKAIVLTLSAIFLTNP